MTKRARKTKKIASSPALPSTDRDYRIRDAADTLMRAQEFKQDRTLMRFVDKELARREKAIKQARK